MSIATITTISTRPSATLALAALLLLALGSCGDRQQQADADADALSSSRAPTTVSELHADHSPARMRLALQDDQPGLWVVRLETMRLIRRERPAGCAELLQQRVLRSRNDFEQAAALDCLVYAYPQEAQTLIPAIAEAFHTEIPDQNRLALVILRYRLSACYGIAVNALVQSGPAAIFAARSLLLHCGPAIAPSLSAAPAREISAQLLLRILVHALEHAQQATADGEAVCAADFPDPALRVLYETYGRQALPVLQQCLQSEGAGGQATAAVALAELDEGMAAPDIYRLLQALPVEEVMNRASYLLALGSLHYIPALDQLIAASHDQQSILLSDGSRAWPLAQAALRGLAGCPEEPAHDALVSALARSDCPAVVVAAAHAMQLRGDAAAADSLTRAADALRAAGAKVEADQVVECEERLTLHGSQVRSILSYVIRYQGSAGSYSVITDQPLVALDASSLAVQSSVDRSQVQEESILLSRTDISTAILLRNNHRLDSLRLGGERLDDVDLIAR